MVKEDGMRGKEWKRRTVCEEKNGKGGRYARKRMEKEDGMRGLAKEWKRRTVLGKKFHIFI